MKYLFSILIVLFSFGGFAQLKFHHDVPFKYLDCEIIINDLLKNGEKSKYFKIAKPSEFLYLDCKYYDEMLKLYGKYELNGEPKAEYCYRNDKNIKTINFSANNFKEIFDNKQKQQLFLEKILTKDFSIDVYIEPEIYIYNNQALALVQGSFWNTLYRFTLLDNKITYEYCTQIIE